MNSEELTDYEHIPLGMPHENKELPSPKSTILNPGDAIILLTDGFLECQNKKEEEISPSKLKEVLSKYVGASPQVLIRQLFEYIDKFAQGADQKEKDDQTALIIRRDFNS